MKYLLILLIAITAMSCGAPATEDPVEKAAAALASGDEKSCQKACDALLSDTAAFNSLSAMQLCRLAELFVLLPGEPDANDGAAVRCLNRARALDTDSVDNYLSSCSTDGAAHLMTLDFVGAYLEMPRDSLVGAEDNPAAYGCQTDSSHEHHTEPQP